VGSFIMDKIDFSQHDLYFRSWSCYLCQTHIFSSKGRVRLHGGAANWWSCCFRVGLVEPEPSQTRSKKLVIPLCSFFMLAFLSMHCGVSHRKFHKLRWASTLNQKHIFVTTSLSKYFDGDSNISQDYRIYTYFSSHFPSLLCSRTSIVQEWGRSHYIISDKCYVSIMLQMF
jgi:hypothetical protein